MTDKKEKPKGIGPRVNRRDFLNTMRLLTSAAAVDPSMFLSAATKAPAITTAIEATSKSLPLEVAENLIELYWKKNGIAGLSTGLYSDLGKRISDTPTSDSLARFFKDHEKCLVGDILHYQEIMGFLQSTTPGKPTALSLALRYYMEATQKLASDHSDLFHKRFTLMQDTLKSWLNDDSIAAKRVALFTDNNSEADLAKGEGLITNNIYQKERLREVLEVAAKAMGMKLDNNPDAQIALLKKFSTHTFPRATIEKLGVDRNLSYYFEGLIQDFQFTGDKPAYALQIERLLDKGDLDISPYHHARSELLDDYELPDEDYIPSLLSPMRISDNVTLPPFSATEKVAAKVKENLLRFPVMLRAEVAKLETCGDIATYEKATSAAEEFIETRWPAIAQAIQTDFAPLEKKSCTEKASPNDEEQLRFEPGRWGNLVRATELMRQNKGIGDD